MRFPTALTVPVVAIAFTGFSFANLPLGNLRTLNSLGSQPAAASPDMAPSLLAQQLAQAPQSTPLNPTIKVGIVQRFGSKAEDKLVIKAVQGDRLAVTMDRADGKTDRLDQPEITIEIKTRPFTEPRLYERLVLSDHRSFESAEDSANQWRAKGIEVEIAQPAGWQVWAKRDTYRTPLLRRLLLDDIQAQGISGPYLDSEVRESFPQASTTVQGYRYDRNQINIASGGETLLVNGVPYPGDLRLQPNAYGTYTLVNNVQIEDYLRGVVPHEIGPNAPQTAVEAQTILARTYALRNLRRFTVDDYEMCADTQCQVYFGWKANVARADAAIAATRGLVLTYDNELIDAVYSSTTGGITAAFTDVWNGEPRPYLQPVVDSVSGSWDLSRRSLADEESFRQFIQQRQGFNEDGWNYFRWTTQATLAELTKDLKSYLKNKKNPLADFNSIQAIAVTERARGGRIQTLQVTTDKGEVVLVKDEVIRAFEAPNSLLCYLEPMVDAQNTLTGYKFIGGGLGHGVGLSQTGSYNLANLGWSNSRILSFYYPNTQLQPLNPDIRYWVEPQILVAPPLAAPAPAVAQPDASAPAVSEPAASAPAVSEPAASAPAATPASPAPAATPRPTNRVIDPAEALSFPASSNLASPSAAPASAPLPASSGGATIADPAAIPVPRP